MDTRLIRVDAERRNFGRSVGLVFFGETANGTLYAAQPLTLQTVDKDSADLDRRPTVELTVEHAQELMERLWSIGLRPSEIGTAGALAATESHLKDMQKIAFDLLAKVES